MDESIIEISGLTKRYGKFTAVDQLSLSVKKGEIYGLLGPNGAGKSTTILMILGLTEPASGTINVCGFNPSLNPVEVKKRVGYLPEDVGFYDDYSGLDNLIYTAALNSIPAGEAKKRAFDLLSRVGLSGEADKAAGKYSRGMKQRLGLADVLIKNPEVIILDEPTLGIDPKGMEEFLDLIVTLRDDGMTILLSSHHLQQVQQICDRVGLFVKGRLIAEGDLTTLSKELFRDEPFTVEADVLLPAGLTHGTVEEKIRSVEGVLSVETREGRMLVSCSRDLTSQIGSAIIAAGGGLNYLNRKSYGLSEIYNRYFENA